MVHCGTCRAAMPGRIAWPSGRPHTCCFCRFALDSRLLQPERYEHALLGLFYEQAMLDHRFRSDLGSLIAGLPDPLPRAVAPSELPLTYKISSGPSWPSGTCGRPAR